MGEEARAVRFDAVLYAVGAAAAGVAAFSDRIPIQRQWGRIAFVLYAAGALAGAVLALAWQRRPARWPGRVRAALVLFLAILLATAGRFGYLLYPIGLFAWVRLVLVPDAQVAHSGMGDAAETLRWSRREGARAAKGSGL